jgi:UDP-N-acetylmuramoyl-L-alanyl-D-glutamate--2,6-diaminopimelate ligase
MCKEAIMRHVIDRSLSSVFDSVFKKESETHPDGNVHSLRRIVTTARFFADSDIEFTSVAESAATARSGELVVYRIGEDCPSRLVAEAMARGAAGILSEQVLPCPLPQCIVGDVNLALADITANQLGHPDRKLLTIGVVGSAGKTTTSLLLATLFRRNGIRTAYQTDLGDSDGIVQSTSSDEVPTGAPLVQWIGEAHDSGCSAAIIECSDDALRHGAYDSIRFDLLVVTGSASGRSDYGESGLQCALDRMANGGVVIAPTDDPCAMRVIGDSSVKNVTYGVRRPADVTAKIVEQGSGMTTLLMTHENTTVVMESSLCGTAMAANHAAATAVGLLIDKPLHEIVERLGELRTVPGCGQRIARHGQATVIVDRGGTPERAAATLRTQRSMKAGGRLWCILAIDAGDSPQRLADYGNLIERFADTAIITSTPESKPKFLSAAHAVLDGVKHCAAMRLVADRQRAIHWAMSEAGPNDTLLVIGGCSGNSPHSRREEIEQLSQFITTEQQAIEESSRAARSEHEPTILKIADLG